MATPAEFRLRLEPGSKAGVYRVVASGPSGDASADFTNPFSDLEFENFILKVRGTRQTNVRRIESPEATATKDFGAKLFAALFADDRLRDIYRTSAQDAKTAGQPLRLTLSMTDAPDLLQIPWEFMYDHPDFLAISRWTPIVRYLDLPQARPPLHVELPLHILAIVSAPTDAAPIDATTEQTKLATAMGPLLESGAVTIDWLFKPSLLSLNHKLNEKDYHVIHYIGHGGYDASTQDGLVLFEDENGLGKRVSGIKLGNILKDEISIRLVVLNSCEGSRGAVDDPFSGVASSLIERGIPAVIGMQFEITDRAAILFGSEFYTALANGMPVDIAVAEARRGIYADDNDIEWGTPVLFMRVEDGQLFDVGEHAKLVAAPRDVLLETAVHVGLKVLPAPVASAAIKDTNAPPGEAPASSEPETRDTDTNAPSQEVGAEADTDSGGTGTADVTAGTGAGETIGQDESTETPSSATWLRRLVAAPMWVRIVSGAAMTVAVFAAFLLFWPDGGDATESPSPSGSSGSSATTPGEGALRGRIAYASDDGIVVVAPDGSGAEHVPGTGSEDKDPAWTRDGASVAHTSSSGIVVSPLDEGGVRREWTDSPDDLGPAWAPDGTTLAFASGLPGDRQVYILYADGTLDPLQETATDTDEHDPAWAPTGFRLAFASGERNEREIVVWSRDSGFDPLTSDEFNDVDPAWSPDGEWIAFASNRAGTFDIWRMPSNGTGAPERLTTGPAVDHDPTWSPDGRAIAFSRDDANGVRQIYVIDLVTREVGNITDGTGDKTHPDWH